MWLNTVNSINWAYRTESSTFVPLQTVKVADFGVARVKAQSGVMTAETGTYRWMAPEVFDLLMLPPSSCSNSFDDIV